MTRTERENAVILIHRHCVPSRTGERYESHYLKTYFGAHPINQGENSLIL